MKKTFIKNGPGIHRYMVDILGLRSYAHQEISLADIVGLREVFESNVNETTVCAFGVSPLLLYVSELSLPSELRLRTWDIVRNIMSKLSERLSRIGVSGRMSIDGYTDMNGENAQLSSAFKELWMVLHYEKVKRMEVVDLLFDAQQDLRAQLLQELTRHPKKPFLNMFSGELSYLAKLSFLSDRDVLKIFDEVWAKDFLKYAPSGTGLDIAAFFRVIVRMQLMKFLYNGIVQRGVLAMSRAEDFARLFQLLQEVYLVPDDSAHWYSAAIYYAHPPKTDRLITEGLWPKDVERRMMLRFTVLGGEPKPDLIIDGIIPANQREIYRKGFLVALWDKDYN